MSRNFFAELKRRHVYRVAVAYVVAAWLLIQAGSILLVTTFQVPAWVMKAFVTVITLGFPVALVFAWAFELTPEGIKREEDSVANESFARHTGRKILGITVILGVIALGLFLFQMFRRAPAGAEAQLQAGLSAPVVEKSVAVLPFANLSEEKGNEFFADGVQDEILTDLAKVADLKVISRTSVMQYKTGLPRNLREIGQQLGVAHILEGNVQRVGNHVRVNAQLIDARTDAHLWAQIYDRDLVDVFAIQSEIARTIAEQLKAEISPNEKAAIAKPPTTDIAAFILYTRASLLAEQVSFSDQPRENLLEAVHLLEQALARDPSFLAAAAGTASAQSLLYLNYDHSPARLAAADAATRLVQQLGPDSGHAHLALAENFYRCHLDFGRALTEVEAARKLLPKDSRVPTLEGFIQRRQGKLQESVTSMQEALNLDPRNVYILEQLSFTYELLHRHAEQAQVLDRSLQIRPNDVQTRANRALVDLQWRGDPKPLHAAVDSILAENAAAAERLSGVWFNLALCERDAEAAKRALTVLKGSFGSDGLHLTRAVGEGVLARMQKNPAAAQSAFVAARAEQTKVVQAQTDYGPAVCVLGLIEAGLGEKENALRDGRRAIELTPITKDSVNGALVIEYFAIIAGWVGEKDLAFEQLEIASRPPTKLNYGRLKLHPIYDPLRNDPRFDKILASLAPK